MTYKEWLTTEAGMRWEKAIKSFVPDYSDLKAVVHITQDVFHASKNAVEAEMRTDDKVAAERERCGAIVQEVTRSYMDGCGTLYGDSSHRDVYGEIVKRIKRGAN